jgi:WASH complex subunit FAM21
VQRYFLIDEEDILFPPPTLTDEDFSPFGSRGGLFSNGQGLFDDEDEVSWAIE